METERKPFYRSILFWELLATGLVLLGLIAGICIGLRNGKQPAAAAKTMQTVPPANTQETLPPLPENPYSPEDFAYEGDYLTCLTDESVLGVDVSYWQGEIDWQQVKQAGVEFAMIRLGWRGSEQGLIFPDDYVQINYEGARKAGLKVGGYFFSQAITVEEALEEAAFVLDMVQSWQLDMPIVFDWEPVEPEVRTAVVDRETLTACARAFCGEIQKAGFQPMIYFNPILAQERLNIQELAEFPCWLAMYDHPMDYPYRVDMWQYTASGIVPGIAGEVDLNLYFPYTEA